MVLRASSLMVEKNREREKTGVCEGHLGERFPCKHMECQREKPERNEADVLESRLSVSRSEGNKRSQERAGLR